VSSRPVRTSRPPRRHAGRGELPHAAAHGPGGLAAAFFDALYRIGRTELVRRLNIDVPGTTEVQP